MAVIGNGSADAKGLDKMNSKSEFDYSTLSSAFDKLGKPAKRALINNGILTVVDLSERTRAEVLGFHGIGNSSLPTLEESLRSQGLKFKD